MKPHTLSRTAYLLAIVLVLLAGLFLRSASLGQMSSTMLTVDEAWNGIDIMGVIQHPHFTPFFENNNGRESGWMYFQVPFVLVFGATPFALRFATVCIGLLTLAAAGRLGCELFGARGGVLMLAALSVFYWHVHLSQMALRVNTYMLMCALSAGYLLRAYRTRKRLDWVVGGMFLGLLGYTYFASYLSILYLGLLVALLAVFKPKNRWALVALVVALIVLLPMGVYAVQHADKFFFRATTTSRLAPAQLMDSLKRWANAWFVLGDDNANFNYPGRPILGPVTGLLAILGLINFGFERRYRLAGLLTLIWGCLTVFPSLVSEYAPHFSRACGLIIPIAITLTSGLSVVGNWCERWMKRSAAGLAPLLLLLPVGVTSYIDFHIKWMAHPDTYFYMEEYINRSVSFLRQQAGPSDYVYFSPFDAGHPVVSFRSYDLAPRHVAAFGSHQCLVVPARRAFYTSLTMYEPDFEAALARWAQVKAVSQDTASPLPQPRYTVFEAEPDLARLNPSGQSPVRFGDMLEMQVLSPLTSTLKADDKAVLWLGIRPLIPLDFYPAVFVHLYGVPTPYQGGRLWAQADSQLCATYPAPLWQTDETIVQAFDLTIPADIPPGDYSIAVGIYPMYANKRLPITAPKNIATDYILVDKFSIPPAAP
jgi:hypothetical protein